MPAKFSAALSGARLLLTSLMVAFMVSACAPDDFQLGKSKQLDAYLNRISQNCGAMYINEFQVWVLALGESADAGYQDFFIDQASMLLYGTITPEQYTADMSGYFDDMSPRGMKTYQCIIAQLPTEMPALPKAYREVQKAVPRITD